MTALEKTIPLPDTLQGAYSHGLESIYKVETIDLKSVRRLQPVAAPVESPSKTVRKQEIQLELDFGPKFRSWVQPYVDREPIQVLQCSKHLEKWLLENGLTTIRTLRLADLSTEPFLRKLGHAHREELSQKLKAYLTDKPLMQMRRFDALSLLKALVGHLDRKKLAVALKPFGLEGFLSLSPMEIAELKKVTPHEESEWRRQVKEAVDLRYYEEVCMRIVEAWILPWIERRGGIASHEELEELMDLLSLDTGAARALFAFLPFPYRELIPSEGSLFFSSVEKKQLSLRYESDFVSYFPSKAYRYKLQDLVDAVMLESLKKGHFPERKLLHALLLISPCFKVDQQFVDIA